MRTPSACPKCGGSMAEGFLVDQGYGQIHAGAWQPGQPQKSFWGGIKQLKREQLKVSSWRCQRCGYLESYAPHP